jgi:Mg/Co/Ni transporter MgtE
MAAIMAEPLPQLRDLVAQSRWDAVVDLLRQHKPREAADAMLRLPFEQQRLLFRHLPAGLAAALAVHFPYFHTYVLLYSLPTSEIAAIVDAISPVDREEFLDALPEESWQSLMKTLEEGRLTPAPAAPKVEEAARRSATDHPGPPDHQGIPATGRQGDSGRRSDGPVG